MTGRAARLPGAQTRAPDRRGSCWAAPALRARQLAARIEAPLAWLDRIGETTELYIFALTPRLALLDPRPFDTLPDIALAASDNKQSATHGPHTVDLPAQHRVSKAWEMPHAPGNPKRSGPQAASASTTASGSHRAGYEVANAHKPEPVLPVGGFRPGRHAASNVTPTRVGRALVQPTPDLQHHATGQGEIEEKELSAPPSTIQQLGELATRVAHARSAVTASAGDRAEAAERENRVRADRNPVRPAEPPFSSASERPAQSPYFDLSRSLLASPRQRSLLSRARVRGHGAFAEQVGSTAEKRADGAVAAPPIRRTQPFHFDPLEPRARTADSDDELADRINDVLREQARRQGVDLS